MSRLTTIFECSHCGAQSPKWSGRCLSCEAWGTYHETTIGLDEKKEPAPPPAEVVDLNKVATENYQRVTTGISECDRVLGGGLVPGSFVLIGGDPGIGKSTLMLQLAHRIKNTLYVSGEESMQQIKSRMDRLSVTAPELKFVSETNVEKIVQTILHLKPPLVIIDSIQTISSVDVPSETGSVNQIRACAVKLLKIAKDNNITVIITGHITKDGTLAGPKTLEHLVDTVIYLEQSARGQAKNNDFIILRTVKNRFGSLDEVGLFEMTNTGLKEIKNPSGVFLDNNQTENPGTAMSCVMEGTRPFLVEVQALTAKTVFGYPQRKSSGLDLNRLQILTTVLTKRAHLNLANQDVHINLVGGLKINDTSLDLAICTAVASSFLNKNLPSQTLCLGEVGLAGEVRNVFRLEQRLSEAHKLGFKQAIVPNVNIKSSLELIKIKNVLELINVIARSATK